MSSVDEWVWEAKRQIQDVVAREPSLAGLLQSVPIGDPPEAGFSTTLASLFGVPDETDAILEAVAQVVDDLEEAQTAVEALKEPIAKSAEIQEALVEVLGLTAVQVALIIASNDPVETARRELRGRGGT